jgi:aryl-alcohol dehydrogenase-like predicted oxidoreductase
MIEKRPFGRTGHDSTAIIFGGFALEQVSQAQADRTLDVLLEYGINHIDTANSYGRSEERIGPWMDGHRGDFFLASKTGERTFKGAWQHLQRSLDLLRTDHLDLWQMHYLLESDEWDVAMGPGGALEAFIEARAQGLVRFLGVTGHDLGIAARHLQSLQRFDFDSVLLPYNYPLMQNPQYAADFDRVVALCQERQVAVQTIKSMARGPWGDAPQQGHTWYKPYTEQADVDRAVGWVLQRPGIFLNTPGDVDLLPKVLDSASRFFTGRAAAPDAAAMEALHAEPLFT